MGYGGKFTLMKYYFLLIMILIIALPSLLYAWVGVGNTEHMYYGFLQVAYERQFWRNSSINNDIYIKRAETGLKGEINQFVKYKMIFSLSREYTFVLFDGYLSIDTPVGDILIGQFKPPFSMERMISVTRRDFIDNAIATGFLPSRDIGISLWGKSKFIEYNLAMLNGTGLNKPEENSKKDYIVRMVLSPITNTKIGFAICFGYLGPDSILEKKRLYNLQGEYKNAKFHLRSEYVLRDDDSADKYKCAFYLQSGYRIKFQPFPETEFLTRYEIYDRNRSAAFDSSSLITVGLNIYLKDYDLRIQLNAERKFNENHHEVSDIFYSGLQFMF